MIVHHRSTDATSAAIAIALMFDFNAIDAFRINILTEALPFSTQSVIQGLWAEWTLQEFGRLKVEVGD